MMRRSHQQRRWDSFGNFLGGAAGYTLLEAIVVLAIIGILGAIAAPSVSHLANVRLLSSAQDQILQTMRRAQQEARNQRINHRASFREVDGVVQLSVHPSTAPSTDIVWDNLPQGVRIDTEATTFRRNSQGVYSIQFNYRGNVSGQLGRMTVWRPHQAMPKRCVFASTLIGVLREEADRKCIRS